MLFFSAECDGVASDRMKRSACDEMKMGPGDEEARTAPKLLSLSFSLSAMKQRYDMLSQCLAWYYLFIVLMGLEEGLGQVQGGRDDAKPRGWFGSPGESLPLLLAAAHRRWAEVVCSLQELQRSSFTSG